MLEITRVLLLGAAGTLLFFLVRQALAGDGRMRLVVLVSFFARAFLSQVLFWIPYLSLPIAPNLQLRDGLWFFAVDSRLYITAAKQAAAGGLDDIIRLTAANPSASYVQSLALFSLLFGEPLAVSLLLNLFCYVGSCAIITRWSATSTGSRNAALIALAAISLSPSAVLWSMQPLKDTFFQFLIVAFFGACFLWQRAWRAQDLRAQTWWAGAAIISVHFLISGVRWYVGFMMLMASFLILPVVALTVRRRRLAGSVAAVFVVLILSRSYLLAAGPYIPPPVKDLLYFRAPLKTAAPIVAQVEQVRGGFDRLKGNTKIVPATQPKALPAARETNVAAPVTAPAVPVRPAITNAPPKSTTPAPERTESRPPQDLANPPATPTVAAAPEPSSAQKLLAGAVAAVLPRTISSRLGLVQIGQSRGFGWFTELDTLLFDAFLLLSLFSIIFRFRDASLRNGVFWLVLAVTILMAGGLFYTVTNFGTLFRHRLMIMTAFALIPLALATAPLRQPAAPPAPESA